ncbi:16717_t:CDS:2, partial [Acaulospora colombiana]
ADESTGDQAKHLNVSGQDLVSFAEKSKSEVRENITALVSVTELRVMEGKDPSPKFINGINGGGNHSAVITNNGELWTSGLNGDGQCRPLSLLGDTFTTINDSSTTVYRRVILSEESESKIMWQHVACGWTFTIGVTQRGLAYVFGRGTFGLTNDGVCYGWGNNKFGQLGHIGKSVEDNDGKISTKRKKEDNSCRFTPVIINIGVEEKIKDVACGQHHTVVLTQKGDLYAFGLNKYGQLGYASPLRIKNCEVPKKVHNLPGKVIEISCGWNTTMALCEDDSHKLFVWGRNDHGQLGMTSVDNRTSNENTDGWICEPTPLCFLPQLLSFIPVGSKIKSFASGSEHSLVATAEGECYAWGWNEHGNCGTGDNIDQRNPIRVDGFDENFVVKGVGAGCGNSWIWIGRR